MTDFRALCAELLDWAEVTAAHYIQLPAVMLRARAALAEGPTVPTDEDLLILHDWMTDEWAANHEFELPPSQYARAVLARWGNLLPVSPADGEVAELISKLQKLCADLDYDDRGDDAGCCYRAAELLQRQAPVPVSVSERLPGPEDCDAKGRCWWGEPQIGDSHDATWNLCTQDEAEEYCTWGTKYGWLPAHAIPLLTAND